MRKSETRESNNRRENDCRKNSETFESLKTIGIKKLENQSKIIALPILRNDFFN